MIVKKTKSYKKIKEKSKNQRLSKVLLTSWEKVSISVNKFSIVSEDSLTWSNSCITLNKTFFEAKETCESSLDKFS